MTVAGICVFFEHAPLHGRLLGGSPWVDSGSAANSDSPVNAEKNPIQPFFAEISSRKHALIQVFAR
jgi:hypothetical protein